MEEKNISEKLLKKGDFVEIEITDISEKGIGIGKYKDLVVFASGTTIGQFCLVEITKAKKNYALARVKNIIQKSTYRKNNGDICQYIAERCGGCAFGEIEYNKQLELKEKQVIEKLKRIAKIENPKVNPIIRAKNEKAYRNKAVLSQAYGNVGFLKNSSHKVIDCHICQLQDKSVMAIADGLRAYMKKYAEDQKKISKILVRLGDAEKEADGNEQEIPVLVGIIGDWNKLSDLQELAYLICQDTYIVSLYGGTKHPKTGEIKWQLISGKPTILCSIGDKKYEVSPGAFFQINNEQVLKLYDKVKEYADLSGDEIVLDCYCGVGTIGLHLVDNAKYIIGIESNKSAILNANRNAVINGIVNARYFQGKAEEILPKLMESGINDFKVEEIDVAIIDPPRAGCDAILLETLAEAKPKKIIYVSCDPGTLARDIAILERIGYVFVESTPVDMFPQCGSVESVNLLKFKE